MSLKDAVRDVAAAMTDYASGEDGSGLEIKVRMLIVSWAAQLQSACKAAGDAPAAQFPLPMHPPAVQHAVMIEKAREEFRKFKQGDSVQQKITGIQTGGDRMLELFGGDNDGVVWPAPEELIEGQSRTRVGNDIYVFRNGRLEFEKKAD